MILTCPACATRYVVKDGAIPPGGRTVRCAQCKHSWHQDPEPSAEETEHALDQPGEVVDAPGEEQPEEAPESGHPLGEPSGTPYAGEYGDHAHPDYASEPDADDAPLPSPAFRPAASDLVGGDPDAMPSFRADEPVEPEAATMPAEAVEAEEPYPEEVVPVSDEPAEQAGQRSSHPLRSARLEADDSYSPYATEDMEEAPRRRWPMILMTALLVIAAVAAAFWFLAPSELKNRLGLATAADTELKIQVNEASRQQLASGNQLFEVSGEVINPSDSVQPVPPIQGQLRSLDQKIVYKWTIPPPAPQLGPGERTTFNSANLDVPDNAACIEVFITPRSPDRCVPNEAAPTVGA